MTRIPPRAVPRLLLALTPVVLAGIGAPALVLAFQGRLPDQAYGTGGFTDSQSWASVAVLPIAWAALVVGLVTPLVLRSPRSVLTMGAVALAWPAAATTAAFVVTTVGRNLDRGPATPGPEHWWTQWPVAEAVLLLLAVLGWWADRAVVEPPPVTSDRPDPAFSRIELAEDEVATWSRTVFSPRTLVVGTVVVALFGGFTLTSTNPLGRIHSLLLLLQALTVLASSWARIRVDAERVDVVQPLLRLCLVSVELRHVVEARTRLLDRREFGFGGYGLVEFGRKFGHRSRPDGEVLSLALTDGREFVVTVDDAATAAALITTMLDRRRGGHDAGQDRSDLEHPAR